MPEQASRKPSSSKNKESSHAPTCTVGFCPICAAVTAVQPIRPDAVEHLVSAAREFLLAAKTLLDATIERTDPSDRESRLERIDIA
jgi:hypothetical protein